MIYNFYRFNTTIPVAQARLVPSVSDIACPFFQNFAKEIPKLFSSYPATYTSLPTTEV